MIETGGTFAKAGRRLHGGTFAATAKLRGMGRTQPQTIPPERSDDFERAFLLAAVGELEADRARCGDCGRTPLVGEDVHRYERGTIVCELCRMLRPEQPEQSERVRHSEHGQAVRVLRGAPRAV